MTPNGKEHLLFCDGTSYSIDGEASLFVERLVFNEIIQAEQDFADRFNQFRPGHRRLYRGP